MILSIEIAIAIYLILALVAIALVFLLDLAEIEQKKAQSLVSLLIPFIGAIFIILFTLYEKTSQIKEVKRRNSYNSGSDDNGIDLHIAQRQHESSSDGD